MDYTVFRSLDNELRVQIYLRCMGALIDDYIYKEHLSIRVVSDISSLSERAIYDIRNARKRPTMDTMLKLCTGLGIAVESFYRPLSPLYHALWGEFLLAETEALYVDLSNYPHLAKQLERERTLL